MSVSRSSATPTASRSTPTDASSWSTSRRPRTSRPDPSSNGTSSSASTSTPSTTGPSTPWRPTSTASPAVPSWCISDCHDGDAALVQQQEPFADDDPERLVLSGGPGPCGLPGAGRDLPGGGRRPLPRLRLRLPLPDPGRRVGDGAMSQPSTAADDVDHDPRAARPPDGLGLRAQPRAVGGHPGPARAGGRRRRRRVRQDDADGRPRGLPRRHRPGPTRPGARPDLHHQGREPAARQGPRGAARRGPARPRHRWWRRRRRTTRSSRPSRPTTPTPPGCSPTTASASATSPTPACSPTPPATSSARAWSSGTPPRFGS